jgi:hypothetical protein
LKLHSCIFPTPEPFRLRGFSRFWGARGKAP